MQSFPPPMSARLRYDSNFLLGFRDACTEAPKALEHRDVEDFVLVTSDTRASGSKFFVKTIEEKRCERYGNLRGFHCTETQEVGLAPAIAKDFLDPSSPQSEKETVRRAVKGILRKLALENLDEVVEQLVPVIGHAGMKSVEDLVGVTSLIFETAVTKPDLFAKLCVRLSEAMPVFPHLAGGKPVTFRRVLLTNCVTVLRGQDGLREGIWSVTKPEQAMERDKNESEAKLRTLGNIKLMGQLFNESMLTDKFLSMCIEKLLGQDRMATPAEKNVETLCVLLTTVGKQLEMNKKTKVAFEEYFARLKVIGESPTLPSRIRFMVRNVLDLRSNKWMSRQEEMTTTTTTVSWWGRRSAMASSVGGERQGAARFGSPRVSFGGLRAWDLLQERQDEWSVSPGTRPPVSTPPATALSRKSVSLVKEYFNVVDLNEARLCVQELNSLSFHPEFVRLAIAAALEMREKECSLVLQLLAHLQSKGLISSSDLKWGVLKVTEGLEDMVLDAPLAPKLLGGTLAELVMSSAVELTAVEEALRKLDDESLQQDVLQAAVAKWKEKENKVLLGEACRKASVDTESLLSVAVVSDLTKVIPIEASSAVVCGHSATKSNEDEFNLRLLLQRVQSFGKEKHHPRNSQT